MTDPQACVPRSGDALEAAVAQLDPDHNAQLLAHDITGDGKPETFCNVFVRLWLALLGVTIPPLLANELFKWFPNEGVALGWRKVDGLLAVARAEFGHPTIGVWCNGAGVHGHIVALVPARNAAGQRIPGAMHTAQAGAKNWSNKPIEGAGLLAVAYTFFTVD